MTPNLLALALVLLPSDLSFLLHVRQRARSGFALPSANPAAAVLLRRRRDSGVEHGHAERRGVLQASRVANVCFGCTSLSALACLQAPQWLDSDSCQKCEQPFFWNIKQMWDSKTLGLRQVRGSPAGVRPRAFPLVSRHTRVSAAPLQEVWEGRLWEMQFQTLHVPPHGLRVPSADVRRLL